MTTVDSTTGARKAWLSIALGVADGLPHPRLLHVLPKSIYLSVDTEAQAQPWLDWLDEVYRHVELPAPSGGVLRSWRGIKDRRHYVIDATEPVATLEPNESARARLAAALLEEVAQ